MADVKAEALVKQLLTVVTPQAANASVETLAADSSFRMPVDVTASALTKQVVLSTTTNVKGAALEIVAAANTASVNEVKALSVVKQVALGTTALVGNSAIEILAKDINFRDPGDTIAKSINKQVALFTPSSKTVQNTTLEVLGKGNVAMPSSLYTVEVVSGLPYGVPVSRSTVEVLALSPITPPTFNQAAVWIVN